MAGGQGAAGGRQRACVAGGEWARLEEVDAVVVVKKMVMLLEFVVVDVIVGDKVVGGGVDGGEDKLKVVW